MTEVDPECNHKQAESGNNLEDQDDGNVFTRAIEKIQAALSNFYAKYGKIMWWVIYGLLLAGYIAYFIYATYHSFNTEDDHRLVWVTCLAVFFVIVYLVKRKWGDVLYEKIVVPVENFVKRHYRIFKW